MGSGTRGELFPQRLGVPINMLRSRLAVASTVTLIVLLAGCTTNSDTATSASTSALPSTTEFDSRWIDLSLDVGEAWIQPDFDLPSDGPDLQFAVRLGDTITIGSSGCPRPTVRISDINVDSARIEPEPRQRIANTDIERDLSIYVSPKLSAGPARLFVRCLDEGDVSDTPSVTRFEILEPGGDPLTPDPSHLPRVCIAVDDRNVCEDP